MPTRRHITSAPALRGRSTGLLRWLVKVPIWLFRRNLGWLFGHRFLVLTHRGRKTRLFRRTMLDVIRYDPTTRESVVLSGWGASADRYRNIQAHPALEVQIARQQYRPRQRFLTPEEAVAVAAEFARYHPIEVRLVPYILRWLGWSIDARPTWQALATEIPLVVFRPRG